MNSIMTKSSGFFGIEINPRINENFVSFRSTDGNARLTFQPSDECAGIHVWAHHKKENASADIPLNEDEEMTQFIERFFNEYEKFEDFYEAFKQEGYWG